MTSLYPVDQLVEHALGDLNTRGHHRNAKDCDPMLILPIDLRHTHAVLVMELILEAPDHAAFILKRHRSIDREFELKNANNHGRVPSGLSN